MADYKLAVVLATGNLGVPNTANYGTIPKLKVSNGLEVTGNISVTGTVDSVDVAQLKTDYDTHDEGTARAQHSAIGDHTHASAGAEAGTVDHGALTGRGDDDHPLYTKADGTRAFSGVVAGIAPTEGTHLATKAYVDSVGTGLQSKPSARVSTTAALPACTYDNGTLGVGATLTANANGALPAQDGVSMAVDDRILVKNQAAALQNGIYKVTALGDVGNPFVFTRVIDSDEAAEVNAGMMLFIDEGTLNGDEQWVLTAEVDTIGTDSQTFVKFGPGTMSHDDLNDISIDDHHARDHDLDASVHGICTKAEFSAKISDDTLLGQLDVDDTPVNAATTAPISSNWAYDHENDADQHPEYQKESEKGSASGYMGLDASSRGSQDPKLHKATHENAGGDEMSLAGLDGEPSTLATHKGLTTGVHGAGANTIEHTGNKAAASGYASLDASSKVVQQPASITDHLTGTPTDGETTKAPTSDWAFDHVGAADPHTVYQKESEREAASGYAGLNASLKVIKDPANATATPTASKIPIADGAGKLAAGWIQEVLAFADLTDDPYADHSGRHENSGADEISVASLSGELADLQKVKDHTHQSAGSGVGGKIDHGLALNGLADDDHTQYLNETRHDSDDHSSFRAADNIFSGDQHINGELIADVFIMDGLYGGPQFAKTIGTGGITAKDAVKFDGSGQLVRRAAASDGFAGIATTTGAATATGYFSPMGILSVVWVAAEEPTVYGEEVFLCNADPNEHKWTTAVPTTGKVFKGTADGIGVNAKVILFANKEYAFEA